MTFPEWCEVTHREAKRVNCLQHAGHLSHTVGISVLCIFLFEQLLRIVAFGTKFFTHGWYVLDLIVVSGSLVCETMLEGSAVAEVAEVAMLLRLWMVAAFCFDICLAQHEERERRELLELAESRHLVKELKADKDGDGIMDGDLNADGILDADEFLTAKYGKGKEKKEE